MRRIYVIACLTTGVLLGGCSGDADSHDALPPIAYAVLPDSAMAIEPGQAEDFPLSRPEGWTAGSVRLIQTQERWRDLWATAAPGGTVPEVDFATNQVLVVRHLSAEAARPPWVVHDPEGRIRAALHPASMVREEPAPDMAVRWYTIPVGESGVYSVDLHSPPPEEVAADI